MEKNEILVAYSNRHGDNLAGMAEGIAEAAGLAELIGDRNKRVGLKPNLVVARPASDGATTHPEIAAGLIAYLKRSGFGNIVILEGSWTGESTARAFTACGYAALAKEAGVELIDTQADSAEAVDCKGMKIEICRSALAIDFMINLPVMKGHCQTLLTCALKNNKGVIPDREKRRFHSLGLHKPIAHLATVVRNDFIVVDGICGDLDFEEGGNPVYAGRVFASRGPVLCDAWAAGLMGYRPDDIPYIGLAERLGVGSSGPAVVRELGSCAGGNNVDGGSVGGNNGETSPPRNKPSGKVKQLASCVNEADACSACYAGLVFALSRLGREERSRLGEICVGQGFRGKAGKRGVGQCTAGFTSFCPGCPPTGVEVLEFLRGKKRPDHP